MVSAWDFLGLKCATKMKILLLCGAGFIGKELFKTLFPANSDVGMKGLKLSTQLGVLALQERKNKQTYLSPCNLLLRVKRVSACLCVERRE